MSTPYQQFLDKINELEKAHPDRDGHDDAYIEGFRHIAKEFNCFDGFGDGGIMETYFVGLYDALVFAKEIKYE